MAVQRARRARPAGRHFLRSRKLAEELVRDSGLNPGELALDVGAGTGVLTAALLRAGTRVHAIELDDALVAGLRRDFPHVEVVPADATRCRWPEEPFIVVANLPFDGATAILRSLLDPHVALRSAEVIVEWGLAVKRTSVWPTTQLGSYWAAWHELTLVRRLPPCVFAPAPAVDAAVLRIVRRVQPLVSPGDAADYLAFLRRGFRAAPRRVVPPRTLKRLALAHGFDPGARAIDLDARQWAALFDAVRSTG